MEKNIKELVEKVEELKAKKKAYDDQIDAEIEQYQALIDEFVGTNIGEEGIYEDDDLVITKSLSASKKIILLRVLESDVARERLVDALKAGRCNGSVTLKFDKDLKGLPDYSNYFDVTPTEKVKITVKEAK